ncbi:hypothetical protein Ahy_A10g048377 isoform B [Arachis hypogaea]|uniref:Neurochondrin n=1 Tax=Arachis hypogaea TaxID=3818 RepID=A0A445B4Z8_ARAHY|nr:hypothetical protein Ahy_A10g048377 isoform B [Arachis hypogaea]
MDADKVSHAGECSTSTSMSQTQQEEHEQCPNMEECLKLLKGDRDEQRLAGLLLVTKFCKAEDHSSLRKVYHAVGTSFLHRLLRTGMPKPESVNNDNRVAYLHLAVTVLAALCRVPDIASSQDMLSKIPLILEVISTPYSLSLSSRLLF